MIMSNDGSDKSGPAACGRDALHRADSPLGLFDDERQHPWLLLVYAAAFVASIALSAVWPWGWA